jgi:hypothetical protein
MASGYCLVASSQGRPRSNGDAGAVSGAAVFLSSDTISETDKSRRYVVMICFK